MSNKKWTEDPFAEQQMKKLGVEWKIEEVDLADIDTEKSAKNFARIGSAVDGGFVDELATCLSNGDKLPMPVLIAVGKKYIIFSGHHRIPAAKKAGCPSVLAYIFHSEDDVVLNNLNKMLNPPIRAVSRSDRLIYARDAVLKFGCTNSEAAKMYCLSTNAVQDYIRGDHARDVLCKMGVIGAAKVPFTTMQILARLKNANVLRAAGTLVCNAKLNGPETSSLVRDILDQNTEAGQIGCVGDLERSLGLNGSANTGSAQREKSQSRGIKSTVLMAISILEKHGNVRTINQWGITDKTAKVHTIERVRKVVKNLDAMCRRSMAGSA